MKKFKMLSKAEMKTVMGGTGQCGVNGPDCPEGMCCNHYGYCGSTPDYCAPSNCQSNCDGEGGSGPSPKIDACVGKNNGDYCVWSFQGTPYAGYCRSYMAGPLACSSLI